MLNEDSDDLERLRAYDKAVRRIYEDTRMPPETRELALAMAWALERAPRPPDGPKYWTTVRRALGVDVIGKPRMGKLIAADAPRYEEPRRWGNGSCEGPRLRPYKPARRPVREAGTCWRDHHPHLGDCMFTEIVYPGAGSTSGSDHTEGGTICGANATIRVSEADMVTGWVTRRWFCRRHSDRAREVKEQLAARGEPPEPIPNTGGLLPRHFAADWVKLYEWHCSKQCMGRWVAPYHGVDADEWPTPGQAMVPRRPRLALVTELDTGT